MKNKEHETIGLDDVENWGALATDYLVEILRGEYDLDTAREDVLSFREKEGE